MLSTRQKFFYLDFVSLLQIVPNRMQQKKKRESEEGFKIFMVQEIIALKSVLFVKVNICWCFEHCRVEISDVDEKRREIFRNGDDFLIPNCMLTFWLGFFQTNQVGVDRSFPVQVVYYGNHV